MELGLTEDQQAIQHAARRFLAGEIDRDRRRRWDDSPAGYDAAFWDAVARLGWLGYGLPREHGGEGASLLELGLLIEECGRAAAPLGIFAAIAGGLALAALGTAAQKRVWLPAVARGERRVALAVAEENATAPDALATAVRRRGRTIVVDGEKRYVDGAGADAFLVAARDGRGLSFVLVPADARGVTLRCRRAFAKEPEGVLGLHRVVLPASALAATPQRAATSLRRLESRLAALLCADMVGGAEAVLDMTVRYVGERQQFGVKLGTFQAVQQMVADMAIALEGARHVTRQALWRLAADLPAGREVAIAKAWTGRTYRDVTLAAHQLHGGAGYVVEHDLHRYAARAKAAELRFGSTEEWLDTLADEMRLLPSRR